MPMWISDAEGTLIRINRACLRMLRLKEEEVLGKYNVLRDDIVERRGLKPLVERVFRNAETVHFEIAYDTATLGQLKLGRSASVVLETTIFPILGPDGRLKNAVIQHEDVTERKRAVEALNRSDALFHAITENVRDVIWILNLSDMRFNYVSPSIAALRGFTPEEIGRQAPEEVMTAESLRYFSETMPGVVDAWTKGLDPEPGKIYAIDQPHRSGTVVHTEVTVTPLRDATGRVVEILGVSRDVTERRRSERALRESEEHFREMFENSPIGMALSALNFRFLRVNPAMCRMVGYAPDELTAMTFADITHPDHLLQDRAGLAELDAGIRESYHSEKRYVRKDGETVWGAVTVAAVRGGEGQLLYRLAMIEDISERKRAEAELVAQQEESEKNRRRADFLADLVERSSQPLGVGYPDGRFGIVNSAFCELLGRNRDEIQRSDWSREITPPEWAEFERGRLEELHRTGGPVRYQKEYVRGDGTRVPVELLVHLVRRPDGSPDYYYSFVTDLTERRRAEEELRRRTGELEKTAEELGRFNRAMVGRENRMIELKAEINALCAELGRPPRYSAGAADARPGEGTGDPGRPGADGA
jgi:PAS domain S-box-containing protein